MFHHMTMVHTTSALNRPDRCRRKSKSSSLAVETGSLERLPAHSKRTSSSDSLSIDSLEAAKEEDDDILEDPKSVASEEFDDEVSVLEPSLSDSWSVDMFPKKDDSFCKKYFQSTASGNLIDHYSFRVVRNSEPQSALYLHGEEIFASIEAVWEVHPEATFFIYGRGPPVPLSFDVRRHLRSILYRTMWQLEFSACPNTYRSSSDSTTTQRSWSSLPSSRRSTRRHRLLWLDLCDAPKNQSASRRNKAPHWII